MLVVFLQNIHDVEAKLLAGVSSNLLFQKLIDDSRLDAAMRVETQLAEKMNQIGVQQSKLFFQRNLMGRNYCGELGVACSTQSIQEPKQEFACMELNFADQIQYFFHYFLQIKVLVYLFLKLGQCENVTKKSDVIVEQGAIDQILVLLFAQELTCNELADFGEHLFRQFFSFLDDDCVDGMESLFGWLSLHEVHQVLEGELMFQTGIGLKVQEFVPELAEVLLSISVPNLVSEFDVFERCLAILVHPRSLLNIIISSIFYGKLLFILLFHYQKIVPEKPPFEDNSQEMDFFNQYKDLFQVTKPQQKTYQATPNRQSFYDPFLKNPQYSPTSLAQQKSISPSPPTVSPKKYPTPSPKRRYEENSMSAELPPILPGYKKQGKSDRNRDNIFSRGNKSLELKSGQTKELRRIMQYAQQRPEYAPLLPAYRQSRSLNKKIKQMKHDYEEFEQFLTSDKGTDIRLVNPEDSEQKLWNSAKIEVKREKQQNYPLEKRRTFWLNGDQSNLLKHTEMNYIFKNQIRDDQYSGPRKIKDSIVPKANQFMSRPIDFESKMYDPTQIFRSRHRMEARISEMPKFSDEGSERRNKQKQIESEATKRRQFAKMNIARRRQKLGYLLRTSW